MLTTKTNLKNISGNLQNCRNTSDHANNYGYAPTDLLHTLNC